MPNDCLKSVIPSLPVEVTLKINNKNTRAASIQIILVSLLLNFEHIQKTGAFIDSKHTLDCCGHPANKHRGLKNATKQRYDIVVILL